MLCPICGLESKETSVTCSKHSTIVYDSHGRVIYWIDGIEIHYKNEPPKYQLPNQETVEKLNFES